MLALVLGLAMTGKDGNLPVVLQVTNTHVLPSLALFDPAGFSHVLSQDFLTRSFLSRVFVRGFTYPRHVLGHSIVGTSKGARDGIVILIVIRFVCLFHNMAGWEYWPLISFER